MKTRLKHILVLVLTLCTILGSAVPAQAAANPSIQSLRVSGVTASSARIDFTTSNPGRKAITRAGVQIRQAGTAKWTTKTDAVAAKYRYYGNLNSWYYVGKGKEVNFALAAGKTYEYRGFCTAGGKDYYSAVKKFSTPKPVTPPQITNLRVSNITSNSARVDFTTSNPGRLSIANAGLQIRKKGTSVWTTKTDTVASQYRTLSSVNSWYVVGKGKEVNISLQPGAQYEYRGFAVAGGKPYYSAIKSFRAIDVPKATLAPSASSKVNAPVNLSAGRWYALTYPGHGAAAGGEAVMQHYAVDWNLPNDADRGQPVYAMADGVIEAVDWNTGSVRIRYNQALTLTNGFTYKSGHWRSWYGHMNTILVSVGNSVKKGQQIGTIGTRAATANHLHFCIYGDTCSSVLTSYATMRQNSRGISPYWIPGLNNASLYCDDQYGTRYPQGLYESTILNTSAMPR